tara:strand:- start:166 stop:1002 length:837 start_codon:yes stop_codon:yes gene_type:complete
MADISKINGVAIANISKLKGRTLANGDKIFGISKPSSGGTAQTFLTKVSDWGSGLGAHPAGWETLANTHIVYGSQAVTRQWSADSGGKTPSSGTGPTDGHDSTQGISGDGREGSSSDYMFTEASGYSNRHFLLRTPELDFSSALANNTLKLYFWFHIHGSHINTSAALGVAATDSSTSAADTTLGKHFTATNAGGLTIVYWDDNSDDGSSTASGVRIAGEQQTEGHGDTTVDAHWRLASVDLNDLAGQSSVYIWFYSKTGTSFRSDVAIDDVEVVGEV